HNRWPCMGSARLLGKDDMHIIWSLWTIDVKPATEARKAGFFMPGGQRMLWKIQLIGRYKKRPKGPFL
ncbi:hypothetical protein, partial [Escherichia coli]|uniref:hypothetical protein n=1 Tax=Escherichia coli TaxID=562 RepID=UPI001BC89DF5